MSRLKSVILFAILVSSPNYSFGDDYEDFKKKAQEQYDQFVKEAEKEYADFREKANREYEEFLRKPWTPTPVKPPMPAPPDPSPKPTVIDDDDDNGDGGKKKIIEDRPIKIDTIVLTPKPKPQPQPIAPIPQEPIPIKLPDVNVTFYGTTMSVRGTGIGSLNVGSCSEDAIATAWRSLCDNPSVNNLIRDCLSLREDYTIPDWGYLQLLDAIASKIVTSNRNSQVFLMGYLFNQSGYKMRYAIDDAGRLVVLFGYKGYIYDTTYIIRDGEKFYTYNAAADAKSMRVCFNGMPKERSLSLTITELPKFAYTAGNTRDFVTHSHPDVKATITVNKNLIDFYDTYPNCTIDNSFLTKWVIHGNTPTSPEIKQQLYPALRKAISGKTQLQAVNLLLRVAESFPYGYDTKIWNCDRAFWMDESWHYPLSDCEDHAINFVHLVRDLLGLDVALVYYTGHLASAVAFTEGEVYGDYMVYGNKRYYICDPTYFYANVGQSMTNIDKSSAVLIPLAK